MAKIFTVRKIRAQNGNNIGRIDIIGNINDVVLWGDEVTPKIIADELKALGQISEIECHLFCYGGDMFASLAIYTMLKSRPEKVSVYIEGAAASGGSIIACAGDVVYMPPAAMMFVHNLLTEPGTVNEHDARELLDEMVKIKEPMINVYMEKSGRSREEVIALMDGESNNGTWLTADEAIEFGLADEYTPEAMMPIEAAACISPGVYNYRGYRIDLTGCDKAAEKTAGIINSIRGGNQMGLFNKKKKVAAKAKTKPKAEIVFVEMVCPSCGGAVNMNPETGEIFAGGTDAQQQEPNAEGNEPSAKKPDANKQGKVLARRLPGNVRASIYSVNCPHCGNDFVWDTDVNADGGDGQEVNKSTPLNGAQQQQAPAKEPATKPNEGTEPQAAAAEAECPNCGAVVEYDTETAETGTDDAGTEGYLLTCPECETEFVEPFPSAAPDAIPVGSSAEAKAAYRAGITAERNRQLALDEMAQAAPDLSGMIQAAKKSGASVETMSRNVIKAMANGKGGSNNAARFAASLGRDIKASGLNVPMGTPQHAGKPKSFFDAAYEKYAQEYNQRNQKGGKNNGKA